MVPAMRWQHRTRHLPARRACATTRMLEKLYRDVKILDIGEGTQQVQRVVVARRLVDFPRDD